MEQKDENTNVLEGKKKEKGQRKRMKGLYTKVKEQMEFYFGDSNLQKDRFLRKKIEESPDGYMDLEIFTHFKKLQSITTDLNVISKALSKSDLIELSEDGKKVRRTKPISDPQDTDDRTVYVECLPHTADHDWIKHIFSSCGKVTYVSLPRYKSTRDIKGFAFVEFETKEQAKKALEELNNPPAEVDQQLGKFPKTRKQLQQLQRKLLHKDDGTINETTSTDTKVEDPKEKDCETPCKPKKSKRRRRNTSECSVEESTPDDSSPIKRQKCASVEKSSKRKSEDSVSSVRKTEDSSNKTEISAKDGDNHRKSVEGADEDSKCVKKNKKKRQRSAVDIQTTESESGDSKAEEGTCSKKPRTSCHEDSCKHEEKEKNEIPDAKKEEDGNLLETSEQMKKVDKNKRKRKKKKHKPKDVPELRVISKKDWLRLRSEYLSNQKKSMQQLKKKLVKISSEKEMKDENKSNEMKIKSDGNEDKGTEKKKKDIEFTPNVIISVFSNKPLLRKKLKEYLGMDQAIAYVDVKEGDERGYIRFKDPDSAKLLSDKPSEDGYSFRLLQDTEEKQYWEKLHSDQENKFKKKKKTRGVDKLIEKANKINKENVQRTHVTFDE